MKTLEELQQFYQTTLLEDLQGLEEQRRRILKTLLSVGLVVAAVAAAAAILLTTVLDGQPMVLLAPLLLGIIILAGVYKYLTRDYVREFKGKIIQRIVTFLDPGLSYVSYGCIPESTFLACQIFRQRPDRYRGDDLVRGTLGKTQIEFSEIHAEYKTETRDSKGRTQTHWHTIFKGLFFLADFNKDFQGQTVVLPDTAERLFGGLGKLLQSWNIGRGELIKLEDPEFEKEFAVYGNDQIEARYILSTSLMKRIVDFKRKTGRTIYLSFVGSRIFVAISFRKDLFEPKVFSTLLDTKPIEEYFGDLQLAIGIVEDLNLNL
ncbi:MAG: DUF3137 domain-containing protein, partial [Sedimentisphaerales bacterium]|nr:DUF3137 domain-containing protein [Sedimentisphaerales bacterium]